MGRYHLFAGAGYYPQSGLSDYEGSYDTQPDAEKFGEDRISLGCDWYSVITERDGSLVEVASKWAK